MTAQKHIIHKVKFNVAFGSQAEAMEGQQRFLQFFKTEVTPALEALLDKYATEEELRVFDRLKIDLGVLPEKPNWAQLSRRLLKQLAEQIGEVSSDSNRQENPRATLSKLEVIQNALLHYLEYGILPTMPFSIDLAADFSRLLEQRPQQLLRALQIAISRSPEIIATRLSRQWEAATLWSLLERKASAVQFTAVQQFFKSLKAAPINKARQWEEIAWQSILIHHFKTSTGATAASSSSADLPADSPRFFFPEFIKKLFSTSAKPQEIERAIRKIQHQELQQALASYLSEMEETEKLSLEEKAAKEQQEKAAEKKVESAATQKTRAAAAAKDAPNTSSRKEKAPEIPIPHGGLFAEGVGVILLHPFFNTYFDACGLLDEKGQFLSEAAAEKGVYLLYFLSTGNTTAKEYELAFQKIICGLPLAFPLSKDVEITPAEIAEGEKLLEAAINYWSALGKTSIAGLREGFLQREGKISEGPEGWVLQVDRQTIDILMDKIPWNISIIRLPWLEHLLRVEWI